MNYLSKNILLVLILSFSQSEIIMEQGSLEGFITSECSSCEYDNYLSHISEGIASPGYNIYAPDSIDVQSNGFGDYKINDLSLIHISEPTRQAEISDAVICV